MANDLLNALRRKLVAYETAGMDAQAAAVKVRLTAEEKAVAKADKKAEAETEAEVADEPSKKTTKEKT